MSNYGCSRIMSANSVGFIIIDRTGTNLRIEDEEEKKKEKKKKMKK